MTIVTLGAWTRWPRTGLSMLTEDLQQAVRVGAAMHRPCRCERTPSGPNASTGVTVCAAADAITSILRRAGALAESVTVTINTADAVSAPLVPGARGVALTREPRFACMCHQAAPHAPAAVTDALRDLLRDATSRCVVASLVRWLLAIHDTNLRRVEAFVNTGCCL